MKIYISGPMTGIPYFNKPLFVEAAKRLRAVGHEVFSPVEHDREIMGDAACDRLFADPHGDIKLAAVLGFTIRKALDGDAAFICQHADALVLLPGWQYSRGANAEVALARALNIPLYAYRSDWQVLSRRVTIHNVTISYSYAQVNDASERCEGKEDLPGSDRSAGLLPKGNRRGGSRKLRRQPAAQSGATPALGQGKKHRPRRLSYTALS